ncbi:hypothetical protein SSX86_030100 [Deinandra increscens subsp. villosa]|uniref:Uncharacterized protein n=1 Tax=Deinandra increscens subsp. villosa TaxID=3103831 RepID=A0AAP0CCL0_9ASTR
MDVYHQIHTHPPDDGSNSTNQNPQLLIPRSFSIPIAPVYDAYSDVTEVDCTPLVDSLKVCSISNEIVSKAPEPIAELPLGAIHIEDSVEVPARKKIKKRSALPQVSTWTHSKLRRSGRAKKSSAPSNTFDTAIPIDDTEMDTPISNLNLTTRKIKGKKLPITLHEGIVIGNNVVQVDSPSIQQGQTSSKCLRKRKHVAVDQATDIADLDESVKKLSKPTKKSSKQIKAAQGKKPPPKPRKPRWFRLRTRSSPLQFFRCIQALRPNQKDAVRKMGFGQLLTFMVDCIPLRLGHYVVDHFSPDLMIIKFGTKQVKVDLLSIKQLLGVPSGNIKIRDDNLLETTDDHVMKWHSRYLDRLVPPSEIVDKIIDAPDEDSFDFRMDFLMCFLSVMVECHHNGRLREKILDYISFDIDWKEIDWCDYILQAMKECKIGWRRQDLSSPFAGPLAILALLYVDSFECEGITFWNKKNLKQREVLEIKKGGFGKRRFKGLSPVVNDGSTEFTCVDVDFMFSEVKKNLAPDGDQDDGNLADESATDSMGKQFNDDQDVNKSPEVTDNDNANFDHMAKSSDENQEDAYDPSNDHKITQLGDDEHVHGVAEDQNKTVLLADLFPTSDVNPQPSNVTATHLHVDLNSSLLFNGKLSVAPNIDSSPNHHIQAIPISFAPSAEKLEETLNKLDSLRVNPIRNKTLSSVMKSPWLDRAVNIDLVPTKEEKKIWDFLFNYQSTAKFKQMRKTLPCDPPLSYPRFLNFNEDRRSDDSPLRVYCPPDIIGGFLLHNQQSDESRRITTFSDNLFNHLKASQISTELKGVDMIFFPAQDSESFFLMVFDLKYPAISVIDSFPTSDSLVKLSDSDCYFDKDMAHKMVT